MPAVLPVVALLLLTLLPPSLALHLSPSDTSATSQHLQLPRYAVANDQTPLQGDFDSSRLRRALRALLDLNDGELQALMAGVPPRDVASRLTPSTAFFLASSRQYLERLNTILATTSSSSHQDASTPVPELTWNPRIARRRKKSRASQRRPHQDTGRSVEVSQDSDSILGALTELSSYLAGGEEDEDRKSKRARRSHHGRGRKHKTVQAQGSSQYEAHHYLYFLRTRECPMTPDGREKMYCPSPDADGEWTCIEDIDLCDGEAQCPKGEDEDPTHCLFHKAMRQHLDELTMFVMRSKWT